MLQIPFLEDKKAKSLWNKSKNEFLKSRVYFVRIKIKMVTILAILAILKIQIGILNQFN